MPSEVRGRNRVPASVAPPWMLGLFGFC